MECEECGYIGRFEGTSDTLSYAIDSFTEEHWRDYHPYPVVSYTWSDTQ